MMRRHISSRHAAQTCIEPSKDTFWLSLPGFAGNISSCTQHSRRAAPLDPSPVMHHVPHVSMLGSRNNLSTVSCCELLCIIPLSTYSLVQAVLLRRPRSALR